MIKNITIVSCHSRVGGNLDTCFRRYDTKFVSPNSIGFTIASSSLRGGVRSRQASLRDHVVVVAIHFNHFLDCFHDCRKLEEEAVLDSTL
ncbi:hypothetical protein [Candidatus Tisiphia endosymbiont of Hybos culiciformis]|uniref:hypothetical protein n=1 Tax=Candidatus Tisiphia endosymbiont of Hybos culiciformis TaxID=3139331 RepID=UPI003CCAF723